MPTPDQMALPPQEVAHGRLPFFRWVTPVCGILLVGIGVTVLVGWATGTSLLIGRVPGAFAMVPNTAAGFVAAGCALLAWAAEPPASWRRAVALLLSGLVGLLGFATLLEHLLHLSFGIDLLAFGASVAAAPWRPAGLMATNSSVAFLCGGLALLLMEQETQRRRRFSELLGAFTVFIGFVAATAYAYQAERLYSFDRGRGMTLLSALSFLLLGIGVLSARPARGVASLVTGIDASGIFLRRLLPAVLLVPLGLGWLWTRATAAGVEPQGGVALFVVASVAVFSVLVLVSASTVRDLDELREESLRRAQLARAEAETANRAKAEFLATMSHELRTPLNAIIGYADLMDLELRGPLTEGQREDVRRVRRSSQYLLGLINDTLNFARLEAGRVEITLDEIPVHDTLAGMETLISPQIEARHLTYRYERCDPGWRAVADRERLEQILVNLLTNACKFTEAGGRITLACELRVRELRIHVRDTGRGISPAKAATIFEPFVQVDRHLTHESQQGVGLGLAISRDLARAMGGDLTVQSTPGEGSVFTVHLRRGAAGAADATARARAAGSAKSVS